MRANSGQIQAFASGAAWLTAWACCMVATAAEPEFRVETDVYVGDEPLAASGATTLFEKSAVYDFVDDPPRVVIYRRGEETRPGQFVLLDGEAKLRTDVAVSRVESLMEKIDKWAATQKDAALQFSSAPKFDETFDPQTGDLTLSHPQWTYRAATVPADDQAALARFQDFADRYAELSTMLYGAAPAGPRRALDAALVRHAAVPVEIRRTTGDDDSLVRSTHIFSWRLSREDRARIDAAQQQLASFQKVENAEFVAALRGQSDGEKPIVRGQSR